MEQDSDVSYDCLQLYHKYTFWTQLHIPQQSKRFSFIYTVKVRYLP